jgi:hypothetical protein
MPLPQDSNREPREGDQRGLSEECRMACPVCGGKLIDIRAKLQCSRCHRICETCCEGGQG